MSRGYQRARDKAKLERDRIGRSILPAFSRQAVEILKRARKEKIKEEVVPKRKKSIKELGVAPGKQFKLYGKVVTIEKVDDSFLVKIVDRGGRFLPQDLEPAES